MWITLQNSILLQGTRMILKSFDTDKIKAARSDKERKGFENEKQSAYLINFELRDSKDHAVFHDIRLEYKGRTAQIDHLIMSKNFIFVIESKFFGGNLEINKESWTVDYGSKKFSIPSPVKQNERHIKVLQDLIDNEAIFPKDKIVPSIMNIVLISNKTIIKGERPKELVYADALEDKITSSILRWIAKNPLRLFSLKQNFSSEELPSIGKKLLMFDKPVMKNTPIVPDPEIIETSIPDPIEEPAVIEPEPLQADEVLLISLKTLRKELAKEFNVTMIHHVFEDRTLQELATMKPKDKAEMLKIFGVGEVKFSRFGQRFLDAINSPKEPVTAKADVSPTCDKCGSNMVLRKGKDGRGDFYGCSSYPKCKHIIKINTTGIAS
ncbi:MAG: NERD domain-containing protein [Paludibacter sp.]|nr:NERD domain-containing protein [Paludibacter sp.]